MIKGKDESCIRAIFVVYNASMLCFSLQEACYLYKINVFYA